MKKLSLFLAIGFMLAGCKNLVPYTDAIRTKYNIQQSDLKRIQFYASDDIILQRKISDGATNIVSGKIKSVNGEKVEEIIVRSGTPGVLVQETNGKLGISFESNDNYFINFGSNSYMDEKYTIAFSELKNKVGKILYNGSAYYTAPESVNALLMVDMRKINKFELNQRIAKGRKIK
jgi:hypothetical protein